MTVSEMVDQLVRDFTKIKPRPKSEVRRKLMSLIFKARNECTRCKNDKVHCACY